MRKRSSVVFAFATLALVSSGVALSARGATGEEVADPLPATLSLAKQLDAASADDSFFAMVALRGAARERQEILRKAAADASLTDAARTKLKQIIADRDAAYARNDAALAAMEKLDAESAIAAYDAVGEKNPALDEDVHAAIHALLGKAIYEFPATEKDGEAIHNKINAILKAGSTDPLVQYLNARAVVLTMLPVMNRLRRFSEAAEALYPSQYPATRKAFAYLELSDYVYLADKIEADPQVWLDRLVEVTQAAIKNDHPPASWVAQFVNGVSTLAAELKLDRKEFFDKVYPDFEKSYPESGVPLMCKGNFYIAYAWDARGSGWGSTVTPQGWADFGSRIEEAEQALEASYAKEPTLAAASESMLTVVMAQSGDLEAHRLWFERALAADPDDDSAFRAMLGALDPRWFGGGEPQMLALGRAAVATGNWKAGLPMNLPWVHLMLARSTVYSDGVELSADYMKRPEVWAEVRPVYEEYLKHHPGDVEARSRLAVWAGTVEEWDLSRQQFEILGNQWTQLSYVDPKEEERLKKEAMTLGVKGAGTGPK